MLLLSFENPENQFGTEENFEYPDTLAFTSMEPFHAAVRDAVPVLRANPQLRSVSLSPSQVIAIAPAHSDPRALANRKLISGVDYLGEARRAYAGVERNLAIVRLEVLLDGNEALVTAHVVEDCLFAGWVKLIVQLDKEVKM